MAARVPAAEAALRILRLLSASGPTQASVIARDLDLPRSTVYDVLSVLVANGFVLHFPEERRYGLGVIAFELGSAYSRQAPVARLSRPVLARLVERLGETCHLAVLHGREVFYVVEERAPRRPALVTDVGVRLPAHLTASGRAILAHLPERQLLALFPGPEAFVDRTGVGPRRLPALRAILAGVRDRGYALEDGDVAVGLASVAAPVLDHNRYPVAGLACTYAVEPAAGGAEVSAAGDEIARARRDVLVREVQRAATELQARLGGGIGA